MNRANFKPIIYEPHLSSHNNSIDPPLSLNDIANARIFYPELYEGKLKFFFDTSTFIFWAKERCFKVSHNFWRNLNSQYLEDSQLGNKSVISLLESEYYREAEEEFFLTNPIDSPKQVYALSIKYFVPGKSFTSEELISMNAGIIGSGLRRDKALNHPLWLALFKNNSLELEDMLDWVATKSNDPRNLPLAIELSEPKTNYCALTWRLQGLTGNFNAAADKGFNNKKSFLFPKIST